MSADMNMASPEAAAASVRAVNLKGGRQRSSSNVSATFPSSHDAFGLSASPSAPSTFPNARATSLLPGQPRPTQVSPGMLGSGSNQPGPNGYGLYGAAPPTNTGQPSLLNSHGESSYHPSSGSQFAHGVLPMNLDPGMRLNRPSALSQAWAGDDTECTVGENGSAPSTRESASPYRAVSAAGNPDHLAVDVNRWRHGLQPSPTLRRTSSSMASAFSGVDGNLQPPGTILSPFRHPSGITQLPSSLRAGSGEQLHPFKQEQAFNSLIDSKGIDANMAGESGNGSGIGSGSPTPNLSDGGNLATPPRRSKTLADRKGKGKGPAASDLQGADGAGDLEGEAFGMSVRRRSSLMESGGKMKVLPPNLRKALAAENNLQLGEIRSEALLQNLILSNPGSLPMTPRPSRHGHGRMLNSFPASDNESDTDDEREDADSSEDDRPFHADEVAGNDKDGPMGMDIDAVMSSPFAFDPVISSSGNANWASGRNPLAASSSITPRAYKTNGGSRRGMASRGSVQSNSSIFGSNIGVEDTMDNINPSANRHGEPQPLGSVSTDGHFVKGSSTAWRESPVASGKSNKRKAAFEDSRFEPYSKRYRAAPEQTTMWGSTLPCNTAVPFPTSPMGGLSWDTADSRPIAGISRARAGSPAATMPTSGKFAVSPLSIPTIPFATGSNQMASSQSGLSYRQNIGIGGLGMLLMSKRQANGQGTGTGLGGNVGEEAVADAIGEMGVGTPEEDNRANVTQDDDDDDDDKMVFD